LSLSIRAHIPHVLSEVRKKRGISIVQVRNAKIHRNSYRVVVNGSVYIEEQDNDVTDDNIRKSCKFIVAKVVKEARTNTNWLNTAKYLPLGFIRISVFRKNYRKRRLLSFGLGDDLVCTIQIQRIKKIRSPDIFAATIEEYGKYRIAWNQAWIEKGHGM